MYERRLGRPIGDVILINALILVQKRRKRHPGMLRSYEVLCPQNFYWRDNRNNFSMSMKSLVVKDTVCSSFRTAPGIHVAF